MALRNIDGRGTLPIQWCPVAPGIFSKLFGGSGRQSADDEIVSGQKVSRRSTGFNEFIREISRERRLEDPRPGLDLARQHHVHDRPGASLPSGRRAAPVQRQVADRFPTATAAATVDVDRFLRENLNFGREEFDAVMFWDLADFLPEPLVKPLIERIHVAMKPGGTMLAFFHTKDAGPEAPFYRYNIAAKDTLELQPVRAFRLQRVFNNRHVENLFRDYSSIKFFLGRDNIREVLVMR